VSIRDVEGRLRAAFFLALQKGGEILRFIVCFVLKV